MLQERIILTTGFVLFTFLFFCFYPLNIAIVDENAYLSTAYTIQQGSFYYDRAGIESAPASLETPGHLISRYAPGNSVLLVPFTSIHWKWAFMRGYILMIIGYIGFILILSHYQLPLSFSLLFLFHPSLVLYSRTTMSDLPAAVICLIGLLFFIKNRIFIAGLLFGLSVTIRYPMLLIPSFFCLVLLYKKEINQFLKLLIGVLIGLIPLTSYHLYYFETITGPASANIIGFSVTNLPTMLIQYIVSLNILYPLMLVSTFKTRLTEKWLFIISSLAFLLFFSLQYYLDTGRSLAETLIRGQRYMLPIIPLLLIPYAEVLYRIKVSNKIIILFSLGLFILNTGIYYKHQQFLREQSNYQKKLYEHTKNAEILICNKDIYELINPFIKSIKWLPFESEGKLLQIDTPELYKNIYLACLARNQDTEKIFFELLNKFPVRKEIYSETYPFYFSIWKLK